MNYVGYAPTLPPGVFITAYAKVFPEGPVVLAIAQDQQVFDVGSISLMPSTNPQLHTVHVPFSPNVTAGTYTGELKVALCTDTSCKSSYAGYASSIAYTITVKPGLRLSVTVNGVAVSAQYTFWLVPGDEVKVVSTLPVERWTPMNETGLALNPVTTDTTWTVVPRAPGGFTLAAQSGWQSASVNFQVDGVRR